MEINKKLIDTIDIFVNKCDNFDKIYKEVINIVNNNTNENIDELYDIVTCYIEIRKEHGIIIKIYDDYKKTAKTKNDEEMYNLSTFNSILENVKNLVQNIDFQYKQFATYFPELVNNNLMTVILIINEKENEDDKKLINMINKIKSVKYENKYKIMKCKKNSNEIKLKIKNNKYVTLKPKSIPSLYLLNKKTMTEVPGNNIKNDEILRSILN
jgi:hypothetical protein